MSKKDQEMAKQDVGQQPPESGSADVETLKEAARREAIAAALKVYSIPEEFVMLAKCDLERQRVTIVTHGGKKVVWTGEAEVPPLTRIEITGINPENAKRRPLTGARK